MPCASDKSPVGQAQDARGAQSRQPAKEMPDDPRYFGTVITPTGDDYNLGLPVLEWCQTPAACYVRFPEPHSKQADR